jgi:DNA helicase-2/ATP-dependent DNA helicase PcrA
MAEERRLFYVGLTRAKNRVTLVRCQQRSTFGSYEQQEPSQFLEDLPEDLVLRQGLSSYSWSSSRQERPKTWFVGTGSQAGASAPVIEQRYHPGDHIRHAVWGEGIVMESRIQDDDETVDVFFESVGFKRLAASMARLEVVAKK